MTATQHKVDWRSWHSWTEPEWPNPESWDQVIDQEAVRSARAQDLPNKIQDQTLLSRMAVLLNRGTS